MNAAKYLNFEEACAHIGRESPEFGMITGYDENNKIFIINFGTITHENALWLAHQIIRHSHSDLIS